MSTKHIAKDEEKESSERQQWQAPTILTILPFDNTEAGGCAPSADNPAGFS